MSSQGERLYRALLRLYPRAFRERWEAELLTLYRDRRRESRHRGRRGRLRLAAHLGTDLARSVPREWIRAAADAAGPGLAGLAGDLRFAVRAFGRRPGFTLTAAVTLGVGLGAATAVWSVVDRVLLRPLPYDRADRLVQVGIRYPDWDGLSSVTPAEYFAWRELGGPVEALAASRTELTALRGEDGPELVPTAAVSPAFFRVLGVDAQRGRLFTAAEDREGAPPRAVVTWEAWARRWGGDPGLVGRAVEMDGRPVTVVGILEPGFVPPEAIWHDGVELYLPLAHAADSIAPDVVGDAFLQVVARLGPGSSPAEAREVLRAAQLGLLEAHGGDPASRDVGVEPLRDRTVGDVGRTLLPFLGAVGLLLVVGCLNVANLLALRATTRAREMGVRVALGASRGRLLRLLLVEGLLLALAGAVVGGLLAWGGIELFRGTAPPELPRLHEVALDLRILGAGLLLALATGAAFGLTPALHGLGSGRARHLRRGVGGGGAARGPTGAVGRILLAGQTALAVVLVSGAAVLGHDLLRLLRVDPGFDPDGVVYLRAVPDGEAWADPDRRVAFYRTLAERVGDLPGVDAAGLTENLPMTGNRSIRNVTVEGWTGHGNGGPEVSWHRVDPGYFPALGLDPVEGRTFTRGDVEAGPVPVVVNRSLAETFWPPGAAVGGRLHFGSRDTRRPWMEVVGVVPDVRQRGLTLPATPELYVPHTAHPGGTLTLVARAAGSEGPVLEGMRRVLGELDPAVPVHRLGRMETVVGESLAFTRFFALVLGAFGTVALLLAAVGVWGSVAWAVRRRRHEVGVRMALGARPERVVALLLRQGVAPLAGGLAAGLAVALLAARGLEALVVDVEPVDPVGMGVGVGLLALAGLLATWLPARRAARVDPATTLRTE